MIEIHITLLIAYFLLACQMTSLIAQFITKNNYWMLGGAGLMPIIIMILIWSDKIFGRG